MADWRKIIVGDAFRLPSNNPRYYLDIALIPIVIVSGIWLALEIGSGRPSTWSMFDVRIASAVFFGALFLASERLVLVAVGLLYVAFQSLTMGLFFIVAKTSSQRLAFLSVGLGAAAVALAIARIRRQHRPYASNPSLWDKLVASFALVGLIIVVLMMLRK